MEKYDGERVLVIGGSSGIGWAIARRLTDGGAQVMVTSRSGGAPAADVIAVRSDITSPADIDALAGQVGQTLGGLDAVFLNAGIPGSSSALEATTEDAYDQVFAANVKGPFFTLQRLLPLLAEGAGVVFTTSVADELGMPNMSVYSASKAALRSLARTLGRELLPRGVRVNAISPGGTDTGILHRNLPAAVADEMVAGFAATNPMGRMGTPDEIARAAVFLAFEATYTTGFELVADGGTTTL
ncbi:SDR family oxidoreductase [Paractinoplanes abujensis]|uniref:NAD(P)-dependent dehydrogenase (Short-subunit alcohol dehydrogenase family) n=1 Tax=Paractinoplanes abujensis TaxID=882441 RepID=A0A7W7CQG0_9ACTN|nr:SDR family oxidoreductase [Actinoplanes abujensis]MBB4692834.1 NAD(P)-dependent dehydrogenase (short-subunit alcohol dehydrogenase family) [Actinoplanes abujensis]